MLAPFDVLDAIYDIASARDEADCLDRVRAQMVKLFTPWTPMLSLQPTRVPERGYELRAHDRLLGHLSIAADAELGEADDDTLRSFAQHVSLALANVRLLDEREHRARRDPLTGLRNAREFHETLAAGGGEPELRPLSLVLFDLDRFKEVNDRGGHAAGDRLLRATAAALSTVCRSGDAAFRVGGDEFALVLHDATRQEATVVAERAASAITQLAGSAGVSWGIAARPQDGLTRDQLVSAADAAMYRHKGHPHAEAELDRKHARRRLVVASRLATRLTMLRDGHAIAAAVVDELHSAFGYYLAVVHRLDDDGVLRVVAGAGPLAQADSEFLAREQSIATGVNGRVARTGTSALIHDTRLDPDYLAVDPREDPGSELSKPIMVDGRVWGVLNLEQLATHAFDGEDLLLADAVVAQTGAALHRCALIDQLEHAFAGTLGVLCDVLESRDAYTARHTDNVADLAISLAEHLRLDPAQLNRLEHCARLHDIGKLAVRTDLLNKPGRLTAAEYREIQQHSIVGGELLSRVPLLAEVGPLVRSVHERWDGTGYPDGLAGAEIPIEARIVAACDAWDAMTSDRPYRPALSAADALGELTSGAGSQFDPRVVDAFTQLADWQTPLSKRLSASPAQRPRAAPRPAV